MICQCERHTDLVDWIGDHPICFSCLQQIKIKQNGFQLNWTILYEYNDFFKSLLFQYKGKGRSELAPIFLYGQVEWLSKQFHDYVVVLVPSSEAQIARRGFNHLSLIIKQLKLPVVDTFYKCSDYQQSTSSNRTLISQYIKLHEIQHLKNKRILLVDDIMTTGHTMKHCLKLLKSLDVEAIHVLLLATKGKT